MSFVRTLATLAAGYAAAKGVDHFKKMGGMAGVQKAMAENPAMAGMADQMGAMMEKMGVPGGGDALQKMMGQFGPQTDQGGAAAAGLGGLMAALGGAAATGQEQAAQMMDSLTGTTAATDTQEANAKLMIRAMIQAAKADGEIDEAERDAILEHMGEMDAEELEFVKAELAAPIDIEGLADDTTEQMKAQVYAMSLMGIRVDHAQEVDYLNGLATALGLSAATRDQVHRSMGVS
ncbi:MAG: DUF533 domain-containing protein [Paracoccaceae bacterium]|nr:DUF533 domain-containing protein [Paracoccaceae bacterium]